MAGEIEKAVIKQNAAQVCDEGGALLFRHGNSQYRQKAGLRFFVAVSWDDLHSSRWCRLAQREHQAVCPVEEGGPMHDIIDLVIGETGRAKPLHMGYRKHGRCCG